MHWWYITAGDLRQVDEIINLHGRNVPAPPKFSPPPVPSPANNKRLNPNTAKYVSLIILTLSQTLLPTRNIH